MTESTTMTMPQAEGLRRIEMKAPDDVSAMLRLKALGWGRAFDRGGTWVFADDGPPLAAGGRLATGDAAGSGVGACGS